MDQSTVIFRGSGGDVSFSKFVSANRIAPDGTPRFAASHLGTFCCPMSHEKDARLKWVKSTSFCIRVSSNMRGKTGFYSK